MILSNREPAGHSGSGLLRPGRVPPFGFWPRHERWPWAVLPGWSSWEAIQSRRRRGAFLYATEQKRGAGTGQLEQNKAVALLGPEISNGGQHTVGVVVGL